MKDVYKLPSLDDHSEENIKLLEEMAEKEYQRQIQLKRQKESSEIKYLIQDDSLEDSPGERELTEEEAKEYEELKKKYGIK